MHNPKDTHLNALKRILRYVKCTLSHGLHLYKSTLTGLIAFTDADWGGCLNTRRSTSGYCVFLSRSSAEAEYHGVANVVFETCWL